jgi:hypothetical protein
VIIKEVIGYMKKKRKIRRWIGEDKMVVKKICLIMGKMKEMLECIEVLV